MYPCLYDQVDYGLSVTGLNTSTETLRVVLDVDRQDEPDVRAWQKAVDLHGTVQVFGLQKGKQYTLYRFKGTKSLPSSGFDSGFEHKKAFQAEGESWRYEDPNPMISSGAYYYVAVPSEAGDAPSDQTIDQVIV